MADANRALELIQKYLDHIATGPELAELERLLAEQPAVADMFADYTRMDAYLSKRLGEERDITSLIPTLRAAGTPSRRPWSLWAAGLAAGALLTLCLWLFWSREKGAEVARYPAPKVTGPYQLLAKPELGRGAELQTSDRPAELELGGYCTVEIQPRSQVRIDGSDFAESVFLEKGEVSCAVKRQHGTFTVQSPVGTVTVTGTRFSVRLVEEKGEAEMLQQSLFVCVLVGAVVVTGAWGSVSLAEGQERKFPAAAEGEKAGTVVGVITAKGDNYIEVKADGDKKGRRYYAHFGKPNTVELVKKQVVGSRIRLEWKFHERLRVLKIEVLEKPKEEKKENRQKK